MPTFVGYRAGGSASSRVGQRRIGTVLLALMLVLAACQSGGSDSDSVESGQEASADADSGEAPDSSDGVADPTDGYRIATQDEGSSWYAYGATIAELLQDEIDLSLQVLPVGGAGANSTLVQRGDAELMINFNNMTRWSYDGTVVFDEAHDNLRGLVGGLDQYYLGIVARDGLDIETLADVRDNQMGIRLFTQSVGSGGEAATRLLLETYGFTYEDIESWGGKVEHTSFDVIKGAFRDGRADIMIHTITANHPATSEIAQTSDIKLIPILEEDVAATLAEDFSMPPVEMPAGSYRGQDDAVPTAGLVSMLGASADVPEDTAYAITAAVIEARDELVQAHPSLERLTVEDAGMSELMGVPLHPGAERYYVENGLLPE